MNRGQVKVELSAVLYQYKNIIDSLAIRLYIGQVFQLTFLLKLPARIVGWQAEGSP